MQHANFTSLPKLHTSDWWRGFFLEGSAKRVFSKGAAKLSFSVICG